jgi:hypothetical protein
VGGAAKPHSNLYGKGAVIGLYLGACRRLGARAVIERLRRLGLVLNDKFGCEICGATWPEMFPFVVDDQLWEKIVDDVEAHLCLSCLEVEMRDKIGRGLVASDFPNFPINAAILAGIRVARREK